MTRPLRIVDTGLRPARWNAAASAALLDAVADGSAPDTLRFHRYLVSAVIGRFQDIAREVDLAAARRLSVALARRVTGGGAVVMGPGVLAWDVAVSGPGPQALGRLCGEAVVAALAGFGIVASRRESGSIEVDGLKVSGSAGRMSGNARLHQATLVLDLDEAAPLSLLRRRTEGGRPTPDPAHRVTSLARLLGRVPPLGTIQGALAAGVADALGVGRAPGGLTAAEDGAADRWLARLGQDGFVLGLDEDTLEGAA